MQYRKIEQVVTGRQTSDGDGVKLTRVLGHTLHRRLDPFLMLDSFCNENPDDYMGGFPDHPHRGFETITYMIAGQMRHRDSAGNEGLLGPSGAQWMTAGSGLIHSELPEQQDGLMEGFQLWLNLPSHLKMSAPNYRDIPASSIPEANLPGIKVRVIAGQFGELYGAVQRPITEPQYYDVHFHEDSEMTTPLSKDFNALVFVYRGEINIEGQSLGKHKMAILENDNDFVKIKGSADSKFILIAGRPLNEPIAQYGPFVMNTSEEIQQAFVDYQAGLFSSAHVQNLS